MSLTLGETLSCECRVRQGDKLLRAAARTGNKAQSSSKSGGFAPHSVRENPAFEAGADEQEAEQQEIALGTGDQTGEMFNQDEGGPSNPFVPENLGIFLHQQIAGTIQSHRSEADLTAREPNVYNQDNVYPGMFSGTENRMPDDRSDSAKRRALRNQLTREADGLDR